MKKFKTKEIVALCIIGALMIATVVVGGFFIVNNVNEANKKAESTGMLSTEDGTIPDTTAGTQSEGEEVTATEEEKKTEKETTKTNQSNGEKTETTSKSDSKESNKKSDKKTNKSNKKSSKTEKSTTKKNSSNGNAIEIVEIETNATHASKKVLKVNGVDCYVGDTIKIRMDIQTPQVLMNFQGYTKYDDKYLKFESVEGNNLPNGQFNDHESCIYYNGSDIGKGYDFTQKGTMYTATFKVLKEGNTGIVNTIEVLTALGDKKDIDGEVINPKDAPVTIGIFK